MPIIYWLFELAASLEESSGCNKSACCHGPQLPRTSQDFPGLPRTPQDFIGHLEATPK